MTARTAAAAVVVALGVLTGPGIGPAAADAGDLTSLPPDHTLPVEDLTATAEDLTATAEDLAFSESSADGSVTDTGHRQFRLAADVLFAFDKATLTPRANGMLQSVVRTMRAEQGATRVTVTGFTDDVGEQAYNVALSGRRAAAVQKVLQTALGAGVAVTATGHGEADPIASNRTEAGRALNRRVEIRLG